MADIAELISDLNTKVIMLQEEANDLNSDNVQQLLLFFHRVKAYKDMLDDITKIVNGIYQKYSYEIIPNRFQEPDLDITSINSRGYRYTVATRLSASIPVHFRTKGHYWLRNHNLGELIKEQTNPKQLSSAINTFIKETNTEPPEDAIVVHKQPYTQVAKA